MNRWKLLVAVAAILLAPGCAMAQQRQYADLTLMRDDDHSRKNDPFVFCTEGVKNGKVWRVITPNTPMISMIGVGWINIYPYCPVPTLVGTQYCEGWPLQDYVAWNDYVKICNNGGTSNDWTSRRGQGSAAQTDHKGYNDH